VWSGFALVEAVWDCIRPSVWGVVEEVEPWSSVQPSPREPTHRSREAVRPERELIRRRVRFVVLGPRQEEKMMAEHPNIRGARAAIEALMRGDTATLAAWIAEDAVWHVPGSHRLSGDLRGRDQILDRGRVMAELGIRTSVDEVHDVLGSGEHVVALLTTTTMGPRGRSSQRVAWVMHARDGMATELWAHNWDQAAIDTVIGG
jgi:uncharacterized protein